MRVLLIEDEPHLGSAVQEHVRAAGHAVALFERREPAEHAVRTVSYDALLLDLHLPDGRGLDFLRKLRRRGDALPVVILTARDLVSDRIEGLKAGADDYIVKPFDLDEVNARLEAVSRRYFGKAVPVLQVGPVELEWESKVARLDGRPVELSAREWAVIEVLGRRRQSTVSKEQIEDALYAFGEEIESNTIEVYVSRIRRKLGRDFIRTIRGLGYRLGDCDVASRSLVSRLIWLLVSSMAGLWLLGSVTAGMLTVFEINERLDNAIEEVAQRLLPATYDAVQQPQAMQQMARQLVATADPKALAYQIIGPTGEIAMRSDNAPVTPFQVAR